MKTLKNNYDVASGNYNPAVCYTMTIKDFLDNWISKIDCMPIHQRVEVLNQGFEKETKTIPSKRQGILGSIMKGVDICEIKINERTKEEREEFNGYQYESIDGGHRKRSIRDFKLGRFALNSKYNSDIGFKKYQELSDEQRQIFENYQIRLVVFKNLSPKMKSLLWQSTNNSTPVNHQEMLNGMGDIPVANGIRELSRNINPSNPNKYHPIFELRHENDKIVPENLTFDPTRLTYDRLVARIWVVCHNGEQPYPCDDEQIEDLYNDSSIDENRRKEIDKKVRECLDFIYRFSQVKRSYKKAKLTQEEFIVLMRLYFSYKQRWNKFKVMNYEEYYNLFSDSYQQFYKKDPSAYAEEFIKSYEKNSQIKKTRCNLFWDNLGKHASMQRWDDTVKWMEHEHLVPDDLIKYGIIQILDTKRSLSSKDREFMLSRQKGKCYIDGKPLTLDDAAAGHVVPYSKGGATDLNNNVMIRKIHNQQMGTMNLEEYKKWYLEKALV